MADTVLLSELVAYVSSDIDMVADGAKSGDCASASCEVQRKRISRSPDFALPATDAMLDASIYLLFADSEIAFIMLTKNLGNAKLQSATQLALPQAVYITWQLKPTWDGNTLHLK